MSMLLSLVVGFWIYCLTVAGNRNDELGTGGRRRRRRRRRMRL